MQASESASETCLSPFLRPYSHRRKNDKCPQIQITPLDSIQRYMRAVEAAGIPVSFVVLFGSQALGNTHEWSDIDLVVVSPRFDGPKLREDIGTLWYMAARTDTRIEPIACGLQQWSDDASSAIIEIARREGQQVQAA